MNFDPNAAAQIDSGIFGLPYDVHHSKIVLLPVGWEATTSYGGGTSGGPHAIFEASKQVDLFDRELGNFFEAGIHMLEESQDVRTWNSQAINADLKAINDLSEKINKYTYEKTKNYINNENKILGLVGGDHSTPFGCIQAYLEKYPQMGILHFDAHADLRKAYEGYEYSHASIMYNVIHKTELKKLVQVGIRDFSEGEYAEIQNSKGRIQTFFDQDFYDKKASGVSWEKIASEIVATLPQDVYVSFDIDGLDPMLCPHTGTPVPGGLSFLEATYLIKQVVKSGRKIIGFDLNEVTPGPEGDEWDANVAARLLYKLCGWTLQSLK